jgi:hypothetical protein
MGLRVPIGDTSPATFGPPKKAKLLDSGTRSRVWRVEFGGERAIVEAVYASTWRTLTGQGLESEVGVADACAAG